MKRLLDAGAIGHGHDALAEAYGPVVLKPAGRTWRSQRIDGGGCLYDYAAHPLDLLTWYLGRAAGGQRAADAGSSPRDRRRRAATLHYADGIRPAHRQLVRRVTTQDDDEDHLWGTHGRIYADRQEIQVYLRDTADHARGYRPGWNVRYTTELTARRGSTCAARSTARSSMLRAADHAGARPAARTTSRSRCADRPGDRDDPRRQRTEPGRSTSAEPHRHDRRGPATTSPWPIGPRSGSRNGSPPVAGQRSAARIGCVRVDEIA